MLKKVTAGDPLVIPATTFNTFVDSANDYLNRVAGRGRGPIPDPRQTGIILVRNDTGHDINRGDVLGAGPALILPADNFEALFENPAISGVTPTAAHAGRFVVLLEAAPPDGIVRAVVSGLAIVSVHFADEADAYADVLPGDTVKLQSGSSGSAVVLWHEPQGTDPWAWSIVRLGGGGGGPGDFIRVRCKPAAAGPGQGTVPPCTFVYDLYSSSGPMTTSPDTRLALSLSPLMPRDPTVQYRQVVGQDWYWGQAFAVTEGTPPVTTWYLYSVAAEQPLTDPCACTTP